MKKLWSYLAVGFAFFSAGIIFAVKFLQIDKVVVHVKKQRIWGRDNRMNVDVPVNIDKPQTGLKQAKFDRKQAKLIKRNEKKLRKAASRFNKKT